MPLYVFACADCGEPFDKLVRNPAAVAEVVCPSCGSAHVKKQVTSFAASFVGASSAASSYASSATCAPGGL
jgi:putative FmdB family regulatory protein